MEYVLAGKRKKKSKLRNLEKATPAQIAEAFAGEVMLLSGDAAIEFDGEVVSTGLRVLDDAIGIGGVPRGRIMELYGPESSAKTSLSLKIVAQFQKNGYKAAFIDAEHALNLKYAREIGVDTDSLLLNQPDSGEAALMLVHKLLKTKAVGVIVVDSVAALTPLREQEKDVEGNTMGMQAQLMSKSLRIINPRVKKSNTLLIFINQTRSKIGVMWGSPITTSGGNALKFYASIRLAVSVVGQYKKGGKMRGIDVKVRVVKDKLAVPFRTAFVRLIYGKGFRSIKGKGGSDE